MACLPSALHTLLSDGREKSHHTALDHIYLMPVAEQILVFADVPLVRRLLSRCTAELTSHFGIYLL